MKVKDANEVGRAGPCNARPDKTAPGVPEQADRISLDGVSSVHMTLATARKAAAALQAAQKTQVLDAVRAGTYQPDARRIAQEILEHAELIARLHRLLER